MKRISSNGLFNTVPEGWREITEAEFAQSHYFTYEPEAFEFRQIHPKGEPHFMSVRLFHMHDKTGYAIYGDYWNKKVRYFAFGCQHEWGGELTESEKSVRLFRCDSVYKCKKCGHFTVIDSSD